MAICSVWKLMVTISPAQKSAPATVTSVPDGPAPVDSDSVGLTRGSHDSGAPGNPGILVSPNAPIWVGGDRDCLLRRRSPLHLA